jgi:hypothetical protein
MVGLSLGLEIPAATASPSKAAAAKPNIAGSRFLSGTFLDFLELFTIIYLKEKP